jgi:hypothetical protein
MLLDAQKVQSTIGLGVIKMALRDDGEVESCAKAQFADAENAAALRKTLCEPLRFHEDTLNLGGTIGCVIDVAVLA